MDRYSKQIPQATSRCFRVPAASLWCLLFFIACRSKPVPAIQEQHEPSRQLTDTQVAQLLSHVSDTLWYQLDADSSNVPEKVHAVYGNLNVDANNELVLWYYEEAEDNGAAYWLNRQSDDKWQLKGRIPLDFFHGEVIPPRIDTAVHALLVYHYGWGTGFGSQILSFYRENADSVACVFELLESEFICLKADCSEERYLEAQYHLITEDTIGVAYYYTITRYPPDAADRSKGKVILEKQLELPFVWRDHCACYTVQAPPGFPLSSAEHFITDGESTFDPYIASLKEPASQQAHRWKFSSKKTKQ